MARNSDHELRDAQHRIRAELSLELARYSRRMLENAYAHAVEAIAQANKAGEDINGVEIGKIAAERAKIEYFTNASIEPALEVTATHQLEAGPGIPEGSFVTNATPPHSKG